MTDIEALAARLLRAHDDPSTRLDGLGPIDSEVDAYGIQLAVAVGLGQRGVGAVAGHKLSFTVRNPPAEGMASAPAHAVLLAGQLLSGGTRLSVAGDPLVEPEVLVRPREDLAPGLSIEELAARVDATAGIEVPVSRFARWWPEGAAPRITRDEFIADGCLAQHLVVGANWIPATRLALDEVRVRLSGPDGEVAEGRGADVMGHPLQALSWLVDKLGVLRAGMVVATGTLTPPARVQPGLYVADFEELGTVAVEFVDDVT